MHRSLTRRVLRPLLLLLVAASVVASFVAVPDVAGAASGTSSTRHDMRTLRQPAPSNDATAGARRAGITYHGGPVLLGTPNVYVIWYGNWPVSSTTPGILTNLLSNIGPSPYYNINTTYFNGSNQHLSNAIHYAASINDSYSQGPALTDAAVQAIVSRAITMSLLPKDTNALYFVLTSSDVSETSGFLTQYCGWHDHGTISGSDVKFSFVGDASLDPSACMAQTSKSPNANVAADGMASVMAHELEETTTDPDLNAWYDSTGMENADKCAWTFGTMYRAPNGSKANMKLGGKDYLIQRNWLNVGKGSCALSF